MKSKYNMKAIRYVFKICYYYVMSFLVMPMGLSSKLINRIKEQFSEEHSDKDMTDVSQTDYDSLIGQEIHKLRRVLNDEDDGESVTICGCSTEEYNDTSDNNSSDTSDDESNESDRESKVTEFNLDDKVYSLKIDSIGKYSLRKGDLDLSDENAHIHINLKRKTIDIATRDGIKSIPLQKSQIVVSGSE
jgi:hypothetical protein